MIEIRDAAIVVPDFLPVTERRSPLAMSETATVFWIVMRVLPLIVTFTDWFCRSLTVSVVPS